MKLGLVRHFKVITNGKKILSTEEFAQAMENYNIAPVKKNELVVNSAEWDICYCSTLPRAVTTAKTIYDKKIIYTDLIVEVPISPFTKRNIKLPISFWHIGSRIAWYKSSKSQIEDIYLTKARVEKFYQLIKESNHKNILIVAHGYFLSMFIKEMKKKGFTGEVDLFIENAKLYELTNN